MREEGSEKNQVRQNPFGLRQTQLRRKRYSVKKDSFSRIIRESRVKIDQKHAGEGEKDNA